MRSPIVIAGVLALASVSLLAQAPVAARISQQNQIFTDYYQAQLKNSPELATSLGDLRYNARLSDASLAEIRRQHAEADSFLARLRAVPTAGMAEQDQLSHDMLVRTLTDADTDFAFKNYEMPVTQMDSLPTSLADLPLNMPFASVKQYEDYLARLHQIPRALAQVTDVMRAGQRDGLMPVRFLLEQVPEQCDGIVKANPFLIPTTKYPATISAADQKRLTAAITQALNTEVFPAYQQFAVFVRTDYAPHGRTTLAIESLPDGKARYAFAIRMGTTTDKTAAEIHQTGLDEVTRITAEMNALAVKQGFKDVAAWRIAIAADPRWTPKNGQQILDDFRRYIAGMQPRLPQLFGLLPKVPVTVEAIPDFQPNESTHYNSGTPDGSRPGRVVVATSDPTSRTLVMDESVAYHEGIPGHHMQISIAQVLPNLPEFRTKLGFYNAYVEGWALYSEQLGKEIGFYQDPVSDYGRLSSEVFRAIRLVVDTGIHDLGWSRQQVIDYMLSNGINRTLAESETDRYISWPGQALGYKIGQLKIRELRTRAQTQLGPRFDIKAFHDEILDGGALPLELLDSRVSAWIAAGGK